MMLKRRRGLTYSEFVGIGVAVWVTGLAIADLFLT